MPGEQLGRAASIVSMAIVPPSKPDCMQISLASLEKPQESTGKPYECPSSVIARLNSTASGPGAVDAAAHVHDPRVADEDQGAARCDELQDDEPAEELGGHLNDRFRPA